MRVKVLYQRDYLHLLVKYGLEPPSQQSEELGEGGPLRLDLPGPAPGASRRPDGGRGVEAEAETA